jgi:predicted TIM-barrel fold metal-dependent hydrolase
MSDYRLVSADSHVIEPMDMWPRYIEPDYRARAPRLVRQGDADMIAIDGLAPTPAGLLATAGQSPEERSLAGGLDKGIAGGWDPVARLADMDKDDIELEVLYPTVSFGMWKAPDLDYQYACMRAYNRWMADYAGTSPGRLVGLGLVSLRDVGRAIEELKGFPAKGLRGACIAATPRAGETYALPRFDPFWAVAQDLGLPISLHVLTGSEEDRDTSGARDFVADYVMWPRFVQQTIADLIAGGVLERFPRLKVISAEIDVGWVGTFLSRLDHAYREHRHWSGACAQLRMLPSEYFHRQVYATFMDDAAGLASREQIGVRNMLWGNDYPHPDACWPHSRETIARGFKGVPDAETRRIVRDNALELYGLA